MTFNSQPPLRVCINARLASGQSGGVEQFVIGLADGLSNLSDGNEEYLFLAYPQADEWLRPYVRGRCRLLYKQSMVTTLVGAGWKQKLKAAPGVYRAWSKFKELTAAGRADAPPHSDGTIEEAGAEVMHFPMQLAFTTKVPSIYQPWDLQHVHLPQFFSEHVRLTREANYRLFCEQAQMVAVATSWTKQDVVRHFGLDEQKVQIVPPAPVLTAYATPSNEDLAATRRKFNLPETFIFYPAQTWPHKNHLALLEALSLLRERDGLSIPLVASGGINDYYSVIERRARALRLTDQIQFLGFVSPIELQSLYRLCRCMIFPSKFEGWGMPLTEAFLTGAPVACSNVTSLPDLAGDAALLFDPDNASEIAASITRLWTNETLRETLAARGKASVARFSRDYTARLFRAHYRRLAKRPLTTDDQALLQAKPLV